MSAAILQYLKNQEARDIAARQETTRQWERIEALTLQTKDTHAALQALIMAVQNSALYQDQAHQWHAKAIEGIATNQVHLSNWLRDNMPRYPVRQSGGAGN